MTTHSFKVSPQQFQRLLSKVIYTAANEIAILEEMTNFDDLFTFFIKTGLAQLPYRNVALSGECTGSVQMFDCLKFDKEEGSSLWLADEWSEDLLPVLLRVFNEHPKWNQISVEMVESVDVQFLEDFGEIWKTKGIRQLG
ncbi:hypothetical protein L596_001549 [Steinernema carpocapsae]|uniref:Uncharacterized protein n=1 Tax=Steinernema carpocapsae TaxID=34508 RepID=A0A4U8UQI7_STECR|nr:hypothetical protein L596_001549 [Steinernema carpocapsae]